MAWSRVNSSNIVAAGTTASAFTTTFGVAVLAGDLIIVNMECNGTHVTNGMSVSDSVNGTYTVLKEQDLSAASSRWMQTFWMVATASTPSGTTITFTPYAANAAACASVDVFRGGIGTISRAVVGTSPAAGTTSLTGALASAPAAGDLVVSMCCSAAAALTPASPFVAGSTSTTNCTTANAYVLSASGASTYASTWTIATSQSNANQVVSFALVKPAVTSIFVCGAECGVAVLGTASAGVEHWATLGGAPSVVTSGPATMRSTRAFRFNPAGASAFLKHTFTTAVGSPATVVGRCAVYFATLPSVDCDIFTFSPGAGNNMGIFFQQSTGSLFASANATTSGFSTTFAVSTGQWYVIDVKVVFDTTRTADWSVNGVAKGQGSLGGQTAATCTGVIVGSSFTQTSDFYIDDVIVSGSIADYPIGAGTVAGLYPNGDRTNSAASPTDGNFGHLYTAVTDFGKGSVGGTNVGLQNVESTSWQSLAKPLNITTGGNLIAEKATSEHMVWTHDALPAALAVNGVMVVATTYSASATANNEGLKISDAAGNANAAWALLDLSETTVTIPIAVISVAPNGALWTDTLVNSAFFRWGDSSDVSPNPFLTGVCLEVDYVATPPVTSRPTPIRLDRNAIVRGAFY